LSTDIHSKPAESLQAWQAQATRPEGDESRERVRIADYCALVREPADMVEMGTGLNGIRGAK